MLSVAVISIVLSILVARCQAEIRNWSQFWSSAIKAAGFNCVRLPDDPHNPNILARVPFRGWIYGYLINDLTLGRSIVYERAGISMNDNLMTLYGDVTEGQTWSWQAVKPLGSQANSATFAFCAQVNTLPSTGQYYLGISAQWSGDN